MFSPPHCGEGLGHKEAALLFRPSESGREFGGTSSSSPSVFSLQSRDALHIF